MKIKLTLASLLLAGTLFAQSTNVSPPILSSPIVDFLSRSNLIGAVYGIYDQTSHKGGGGVALAYKMNEFVVPTLRIDYINSTIWNPSISLQLQVPITILGKWRAIPFAFDGLATVVSGKGKRNLEAENIAGVGLAIGFKSDTSFYVPKGIVFDYERWTGSGFNDNQFRGGVYWKF